MSPVERARSLVGCAYRKGGRVPCEGLDCLGLVLTVHAIGDMASRPLSLACAQRRIERWFVPVAVAGEGDLLLMCKGRRIHFAIQDGDAVIHADARARRVVRRTGPAPWPVIETYRRIDGDACTANGR